MSPVQDVNFELTVGDATVSVAFIASEFIDFQDDVFTPVTDETSDNSDPVVNGKFFAKWFPSLPNWTAILLDVLALVVMCVIVALVIWLVVKCFRSRRTKMKRF